MKLQDLPDDFTPEQFMKLDHEELELVPHDRYKWICQCKKCIRGTAIKDFGIQPWFYWRKQWINLNLNYFLCGKHTKIFRRLKKSFDELTIADKFLDYSQMPMEKLQLLKQNIHIDNLKINLQ